MIGIGIIGAARVATYAVIAPARALPHVEIRAVAARDPERGRAYAATHGIPTVHADYAALCADPAVDLVYVATPPAFHLDHARLAFAAGKPALVEKPFTRDAAEAEALLAAARAAGVPAYEAMHSRFAAYWPRLFELLPRIGALRHIDARFDATVSTADTEFRWDAGLGGGALMDLGVYPLAWVRAIAGEPLGVRDVTVRRQRAADGAFAATLDLPGSVTARIASDLAAPFGSELVVRGRDGTLRVDNALAPQRGGHALTLTTAAGTEDHSVPGPGTYDAQLAAVTAALTGTTPWPLAPDDPLRSMRAIDRVRAAVPG